MAVAFSITGELVKNLKADVYNDIATSTVWARKIDPMHISGSTVLGYNYTGGDAVFIPGSAMTNTNLWESDKVTVENKEASIIGVEYCSAYLTHLQILQSTDQAIEKNIQRQLRGKLSWALDATYGRVAAKVALAAGGNKVTLPTAAKPNGAAVLDALYEVESKMADAAFSAEGTIIGMSAEYFDALRKERGLVDTNFVSADGTDINQARLRVGGMTIQRLPFWSKFAVNTTTIEGLPEERKGDFTKVVAVAINPEAIIAADNGEASFKHRELDNHNHRLDIIYAHAAAVQVGAGVGVVVKA
jgi:hypothetical protein